MTGELDDLTLPVGTRLVHLGPPKTGTTAIQNALHAARSKLREHGVCYPGTTNRPRDAGWAVVGAGVPRGRRQPTMADWDELVEEVAATDDDQRVVVSNESFALAYEEAANKIVTELGDGRIHIVYVVRRIDKLLNSHWQQRVQAGLTLPYDEWLRIALGEPNPKNQHWRGFWRHHSLEDVMQRWIEPAGAENISLVVADEGDRELLPRLFERFLDLPENFLQVPGNEMNRSFSRNEIELMRELHLQAKTRGWSDQVFRHVIRFGVVRELSARERSADDVSIALPRWASERAAELNAQRVELMKTLGVNVIGDPALLHEAPSGSDDSGADIRVDPRAAAEAIAAAIDADENWRGGALNRLHGRLDAARERAQKASQRADQARKRAKEAEGKLASAARPRPASRRVDEVTSKELLGIVRTRVANRLLRR